MSLITQQQYNEISSWFQGGGKLMNLGCRPRSSQQIMVDYITSSLDAELSLICEAPTGVGKTYSYLFPLAAVISDSKRTESPLCAIISTSTKGLQRQLKTKDFPAVANLFPRLSTRIWMGANNYLCGVRLRKALASKMDPDIREEIEKLNGIYGQLRGLPNGWREELPFEIQDATWEKISGDTPCCNVGNEKMKLQNEEFFCKKNEAFKAAKAADILCVNHSLLCSLGLYMGRIHPDPEKDPSKILLVVDEAHDLEDNLRRCLNFDFSFPSLRKLTRKIVDGKVEHHFQEQLSDIKDNISDFLGEEPIVLTSNTEPVCKSLLHFASTMELIAGSLSQQTEEGSSTGVDLSEDDKREIKAKAAQMTERAASLRTYINNPTKDTLLEISKATNLGSDPKGSDPSIQLCPFNLDEQLSQLWELANVKILTSATLFNSTEVETKIQYCLPDAVTTVIPPNFDYGEVIRAYAVDNGSNKAMDIVELIPWVKTAIEMSAGNALVLFTSYAAMNEAQNQLRDWASRQKYNLLVQSRKSQPQQLIDSMAAIPNSIIFGTNTFWTGVDIKGKNLCNVIVTKLPFRMPDNYVKQYGEYLKQKGINAFYQWSVPDMINKTRQGIGRLIRDEGDKGLLFMLDPRFLSSKYGSKLRRLIYPDDKGVSTLEWTSVQMVGDLEPNQETLDWLGVKEPDLIIPVYTEDDEDGEIPF